MHFEQFAQEFTLPPLDTCVVEMDGIEAEILPPLIRMSPHANEAT